jgi:hypothetical protein
VRKSIVPVVSKSLFMVVLSVGFRSLASAQDLEPRAYANTPVGLNFLIGGYAYSKGTVGTDPSVPITDTQIKLNSAVLAYVRTLDLWGRSGKVDVIVPYTWADGSAKVAGQERTRKVSGFNDPRLRVSMLLYGAPALSLEDFRDYKPDVIAGMSLEVTPPLGQYDSDKLLNIGTNRWSFKPEVGVSKTWGPLTLELASGVRFYTDNNDFLNGKTLQVRPIYSVQGHLIYSITPGIWLGLDGLYYAGARGTIDGKKGQSLENARVGLTLALPINRYNSVKLYGSTNVYTKTGADLAYSASHGNSVGVGDFSCESVHEGRGKRFEVGKIVISDRCSVNSDPKHLSRFRVSGRSRCQWQNHPQARHLNLIHMKVHGNRRRVQCEEISVCRKSCATKRCVSLLSPRPIRFRAAW